VQFAADQAGGNTLLTLLPIILVFVAIYFLMLRPQSKKRRDAAAMQSKLGPGDEVQTVDGMFGTVAAIDGDEVRIEAAPGVELRFARGAIARVVNPVASTDVDTSADDTARTIEQS